MTARTGFTQLQNITRGLNRTTKPRLPPAIGYQGDVEYMQQVTSWRQWIDWEKDDNLVLKDEDAAQYHARVLYTYKQALMAVYYYPELWFEAVEYCFTNGLDEDAKKFLTQGIAANPESSLLAFKLADHIETSTTNDEGSDPGAKARMKKVREPYDKVLDALYELIKKVSTREAQEVQRIEVESESISGGADGEDDVNAANVSAKKAATDAHVAAVKQAAQLQVDQLSKIISHVWISLMRATRRIQGKGLPTERGASGFRIVFNDARKRGKLTSDFYVESAQLEWQCYKDPTGTRILERGLKLYPEDEYLPLEYIKHLISTHDVTNARAVFETTAARLLNNGDEASAEKAKPLFVFFHDYESKYGELSQVVRLEERMKQHFPGDPSLQQFSKRFATSRFNPVNVSPVVSPTQLQPKAMAHPSVEMGDAINSPIQKVIDSITTNSPKRPFPADDSDDTPPRKMARGESPLKGAAGRRMNEQQNQNQQRRGNGMPSMGMAALSMPPPLPQSINYLLSILPKAHTYTETRFESAKVVGLIRDIKLPAPGTVGQHYPHAQAPQLAQHLPAPAQAWPQYAPQQAPPMLPPQGFMQPSPVGQGQYGAR